MVAFLCLIIYLNIHKQAKSRHGKIETVVFIRVSKNAKTNVGNVNKGGKSCLGYRFYFWLGP